MGTTTFKRIATENIHDSNLTELNATDAVNNGFIDHSDWLAHVMRYAAVIKYMKKSSMSHERVIDVGCGRFPMLTFMWRNRVPLDNVTYVGIDLRAKEDWLREDKIPSKPNIELIQADVIESDLSFVKPGDIVVCTEVLEHIDKAHALKLLKLLRSLVKDSGLVFISSPNLGGSTSVADNHTDADGSPREWTYEGKVALIERAGLHIESAMGTFIRLDNIPADFYNEYTVAIKDRLPNSFFRVFAAAAFPAASNNAMFICSPA